VEVEYATTRSFSDARRTPAIVAEEATDLVVVHRIEGLAPGTNYHYRVYVDGREHKGLGQGGQRFRTAPEGPAAFRMMYGSCARVQVDPVQAIWGVVEQQKPDFFAWIGDNIYGDSLRAETLAEEYRHQRMIPALQPVLRGVPQLAVWDDHDFGLNDHDGTHPRKAEALAVFRQYWPNPAHGTPETPGVFFAHHHGGVDFFFVDCRYHRSPNDAPDGPEKTFLGAGQLAWLKASLKASTAPFKVLVSGSGWTAAKGAGGDSWAAFLHERDQLFDFIRDEAIGGVVLLSGDTHCGELNCIPWSARGGYDLYDLVSSPLAQPGSSNWKERKPEQRLRPGVSQVNVGQIDFDLTANPPTLTFVLLSPDGAPAWEPLTLSTEDLRNGVQSWERNKRFED
jgi:alkaline phosphatase D